LPLGLVPRHCGRIRSQSPPKLTPGSKNISSAQGFGAGGRETYAAAGEDGGDGERDAGLLRHLQRRRSEREKVWPVGAAINDGAVKRRRRLLTIKTLGAMGREEEEEDAEGFGLERVYRSGAATPCGCARVSTMEDSTLQSRYYSFYNILPQFQNIRCFSFVKQMYLDIF
jgi:hypothetical protein